MPSPTREHVVKKVLGEARLGRMALKTRAQKQKLVPSGLGNACRQMPFVPLNTQSAVEPSGLSDRQKVTSGKRVASGSDVVSPFWWHIQCIRVQSVFRPLPCLLFGNQLFSK